ncbi:MAG: hypothetical protein ABEJ71_02645, partial [Halodesulfurarchaeum sp.]
MIDDILELFLLGEIVEGLTDLLAIVGVIIVALALVSIAALVFFWVDLDLLSWLVVVLVALVAGGVGFGAGMTVQKV